MFLALVAAPPTALFATEGLSPDDVRDLEAATSSATGLSLVDTTRLTAALAARAESLGPTPLEGLAKDLERARKAYLGLRLDAATRIYDEALSRLIANRRTPAPPSMVARIFFERGVVAIADRKKRAGAEAMRAAVRIDPKLSASPDLYGPPVLRALERARRRAGKERAIDVVVERAPEDATVEIDGRVVTGMVRLRGRGPHLLTAHRTGYAPVSRLFDAEPGQPVTVVLERADDALAADQTLARLTKDGIAALDLVDAAGAAGFENVIVAKKSGDGVEATWHETKPRRVRRSVRGQREDWEPYPWAVVATALDGRNMERGELALTVSAPESVPPESAVEIAVQVVDENRRLRALEARCGQVSTKHDGVESGRSYLLSLPVPPDTTAMTCTVTGIDRNGAAAVSAPAAETPLEVRIVEPSGGPWYGQWYFWAAVGVAAAAGVTAVAVAARAEPEQEALLRVAP